MAIRTAKLRPMIRVIRAPEAQRARRLTYRREPALGTPMGGRNLPSPVSNMQGARAVLDARRTEMDRRDFRAELGFVPCKLEDCEDRELHAEHSRPRRAR